MATNAEKLGMSEAETINALGAYFNSTVIEALAYGLYAIVFVYTFLQRGKRFPESPLLQLTVRILQGRRVVPVNKSGFSVSFV